MGNVFAGLSVGVGFLLFMLGLLGTYNQVQQFGIKLPGAPELTTNPRTIPGGTTAPQPTQGGTMSL